MAKNRDSKIKPTSKRIIVHLRNGKSVGDIVRLGYSESTVKYYRRKLFNPESYNRFIGLVVGYNRNKKEAQVIHS